MFKKYLSCHSQSFRDSISANVIPPLFSIESFYLHVTKAYSNMSTQVMPAVSYDV